MKMDEVNKTQTEFNKDNPLDYNSKNLDRIRYKLLEQFCQMMQSNTYIHNFGKNAAHLIEETFEKNSDILCTQFQNEGKIDKFFLEQLLEDNERSRETLRLLHSQQEHCWMSSKLHTQFAMLDFNALANEIKTMLETLEHHSMHDPLTELHNRRYFNAIINYEISRSQRHNHTFCLLIIDLDDFKKINDTFGHFSGDEMLKQLASLMRQNFRKGDVVARIGGDEFAILLTETTLESGLKVAQSFLEKISAHIFHDSQGHSFQTSISIGITNYPHHAKSLEMLNNHADEALYKAKNSGKNRIAVFEPENKK